MGVKRRAAWRAGIVLLAAVGAVGIVAGTAGAGSNGSGNSPAADEITPPSGATWTTVFTGTMSGIEGLAGDDHGNLYVAERGGGSNPCPVWKIVAATGVKTQVGYVPGPCSPSGLGFGPDGRLYITGADGPALDDIDVLAPGDAGTEATVFATGVPQANGIAFDRHGNLWATDGQNKKGIIYRVGPGGGAATEVFRIPAMANDIGVGRQNGTLQGVSPNTPNPQDIVANGIVVTRSGDLIISDTARGALWRVKLDGNGDVVSPVGCDETYPADTLCLSDVFEQTPYLEGVDGITLDPDGRVWADANERQAVIVVDPDGRPTEFFRNAVDPTTGRRNGGPLENPTSPVFVGHTLCTTSSDTNRRDNFPNSGGEVTATGKVSCLDQPVRLN